MPRERIDIDGIARESLTVVRQLWEFNGTPGYFTSYHRTTESWDAFVHGIAARDIRMDGQPEAFNLTQSWNLHQRGARAFCRNSMFDCLIETKTGRAIPLSPFAPPVLPGVPNQSDMDKSTQDSLKNPTNPTSHMKEDHTMANTSGNVPPMTTTDALKESFIQGGKLAAARTTNRAISVLLLDESGLSAKYPILQTEKGRAAFEMFLPTMIHAAATNLPLPKAEFVAKCAQVSMTAGMADGIGLVMEDLMGLLLPLWGKLVTLLESSPLVLKEGVDQPIPAGAAAGAKVKATAGVG